MKVKIENVTNIKNGEVQINKDSLNIKYGPNGIGKSSLGKALFHFINSDDLSNPAFHLSPFCGGKTPSVVLDEPMSSCLLFDTTYIKKCIINNDDLLNGTLRLIIKYPKYDDTVKEITALLSGLVSAVKEPNIQSYFAECKTISESFSFGEGGLDRRNKTGKALKECVNYVPSSIDPLITQYQKFIESSHNFEWIRWVADGKQVLKDVPSDNCPFCDAELPKDINTKIEKIEAIGKPKAIQDNFAARDQLSSAKSYLSDKDAGGIDAYLSIGNVKATIAQDKILGLSLSTMQGDYKRLQLAMSLDQNTLVHQLDKGKLVISESDLSIDPSHLNPEKSDLIANIEAYNKAIKTLFARINDLQAAVGKYQSVLRESISGKEKFLDDFMKFAGIPYEISIKENDEQNDYVTSLVPITSRSVFVSSSEVEDVLSYGERNAICLMLFAIEAITVKPDLVILDDPVSSFDGNKRFAMMNFLFSSEAGSIGPSFSKQTVLLLAHDLTPIIDFVKLKLPGPNCSTVFATMISSANGTLSEKQITADDINSRLIAEKKKAQSRLSSIPLRIISCRRYYEMIGNFGPSYDILSSLVHRRPCPKKNDVPLTKEEFAEGEKELKTIVADFDYSKWLSNLSTNVLISQYVKSTSAFEKLCITRFAYSDQIKQKVSNNISKEFIDDVFHIEHEYVFGLDMDEFDQIPDYVVCLCDKLIKEASAIG